MAMITTTAHKAQT